MALSENGNDLPVGKAFQIVNCPISDRVLDALPLSTMTDVRFINTEVSFDAVADRVGDSFEVLVLGERGYGLTQGWDWTSHRGWAWDGLKIWIEQDPTELTAAQLARLPNLNSVRVDRKKPLVTYCCTCEITRG
ncbi:MAG: hypothetical protein HKN47_03250 [Pirellulaceae bacterium]|nr:hypothetical protein [Pirellulaceae bacterium]